MSEIVEVRNVSKHFGDFAALDDVSFNISPGSIVGLIGPNGAGKTTTLKSILGLTSFDGEMRVLGEDPRSGRHKIMERVCFIADVGVLPRWLRVSDALDYIQGIHPRFNRDRAEVMLAETKISKRSKVKELSKGMVTQLHLALVMAIEVDLLVLDEPTLGLDILFRKAFYERLLND
ncbi:MAG TPA: ABC transporter ATP-binding protein, partial [Gammaproteobacteria bacterium]|nr:ABC transporter ATP-binding protein [Gammaproteobacteria bacterium]